MFSMIANSHLWLPNTKNMPRLNWECAVNLNTHQIWKTWHIEKNINYTFNNIYWSCIEIINFCIWYYINIYLKSLVFLLFEMWLSKVKIVFVTHIMFLLGSADLDSGCVVSDDYFLSLTYVSPWFDATIIWQKIRNNTGFWVPGEVTSSEPSCWNHPSHLILPPSPSPLPITMILF